MVPKEEQHVYKQQLVLASLKENLFFFAFDHFTFIKR